MNKAYALTLLDESIRTVKCRFNHGGKVYSYLTADLNIKEGDAVVVHTNTNENTTGFAVVEVVAVDDIPDIDQNSSVDYKWIVSRVDLTDYELRRQWAEKASKELRTVVRQRHREQALATLGLAGSDLARISQPLAPADEHAKSPIYSAGWFAAQSGIKPDANPYTSDSDRGVWTLGYRAFVQADNLKRKA